MDILNGDPEWNNPSCANNYDPNTFYAVYDLNQIGSLTCDELASYGWVDPFFVNGEILWTVYVLVLFGNPVPAFYDSQARTECPGVFP